MSRPFLGPIRHATVVTPRLDASAQAYRRWLGYLTQDEGRVPGALAAAWRAPRSAGAPYVVVGPASGIGGGVRLVEGRVPHDYRPARTLGWAGIEICVPDVDGLARRLDGSPFRTLVPPAALAGLSRPALRAMQCAGPSGELVYFTEILAPLPPFDLPRCSGDIDGVFIAVVAAADLETTRGWFEERFDVVRASDRQVAVQVINKAFELPADMLHRISSLQLLDQTAIEHDQYPRQAVPRPTVPGHLPPGVASVALGVRPADAIASGVLIGPDGLRVELLSG
ncbi:hypothetical protein Drose_25185 [Dactylosporangium roseum]|uniref:VOC domain-containing protein n=1 Tax=Dactylosporangium roseum TaxID=47989 RepID=A0ABY5YXP1_9ACTN|nr:hypothetical protein [Dactylosporangium roseum]UWZ34509.1 hypothetical protein Drose_25185 [Dactylosporangium roseum]